jgi:predicted hydrocarbon binding protein
LKPGRKKVMGFYYSERPTFHIIARIKDSPGALRSVLDVLSDHVDLIGSLSYGLDDGTAMWSGFAYPLSKNETPTRLAKLVKKSSMVLESRVTGSDQGLLADTFHAGLEYGPGRAGVILPFAGISRMFDRLVVDFGSGGKTILYQEGKGIGAASAQYLNSLLGPQRLDWKVGALVALYRTIGWGVTSLEVDRSKAAYTVKVQDCFECTDGERVRKECGFLRGHLTSTVSSLSGSEFEGTETKCRLRGDSYCEFHLVKKA